MPVSRFLRETRSSGAFVTRRRPEEWRELHRAFLTEYNKSSKVQFVYPQSFHCGPLLELQEQVAPKGANREAVTLDSLRNALCMFPRPEHCLFVFAAKNRRDRFEWSWQTSYGVTLLAAIRLALVDLGKRTREIDAVEFVVANRATHETHQNNGPADYLIGVVRLCSVNKWPAEKARGLFWPAGFSMATALADR